MAFGRASLLVPGIVDQALVIGHWLPIIDLIAGNARLEDQIGIAPDRIEGIILHRTQTLENARQIGGSEVIGGEKAARL
jgi:hypothetical protein